MKDELTPGEGIPTLKVTHTPTGNDPNSAAIDRRSFSPIKIPAKSP